MKRLAHISDLHFGREDEQVKISLLNDLELQKPDIIIISGDMTQRGRTSQYIKAREFLLQLKSKFIVIPGNHDIPLFDLFTRFLFPLNRFRKYINKELFPFYLDDELTVLGINTARSLTWKNGRISYEQINYIKNKLCNIDNNIIKILVTHHPFIPPPGDNGISLVGRSKKAMTVIEECGIDMLLSGHLHIGYSGDIRTYYAKEKRSLISVQAGTAISIRRRNEPNGYNIIDIDNTNINIQVRSWQDGLFSKNNLTSYKLINNIWTM